MEQIFEQKFNIWLICQQNSCMGRCNIPVDTILALRTTIEIRLQINNGVEKLYKIFNNFGIWRGAEPPKSSKILTRRAAPPNFPAPGPRQECCIGTE